MASPDYPSASDVKLGVGENKVEPDGQHFNSLPSPQLYLVSGPRVARFSPIFSSNFTN